MDIFLNIMLLVLGMVLLIKGADMFVDGSSSIAKLLKIPTLIIGLTLVSIGTSAPELSVSITSSINKQGDLSFGNVIGSNTFNILMVIGISTIIAPLTISKDLKKIDIPVLIFIYLVLMLFSFVITPYKLDIIESIIILALFFIYMFFLIFRSIKAKIDEPEENKVEENSKFGRYVPLILFGFGFITFLINLTQKGDNTNFVLTYLSYALTIIVMVLEKLKCTQNLSKLKQFALDIVLVSVGIFAIIMGGNVVVNSASFIASKLGMSDALIGLTIVAIGTSLPELVTSLIAAKKNENDIALGNAIGSCIFNVILILGLSSTISPIHFDPSYLVDLLVMIFSIVYVFIATLKEVKLKRVHGVVMVCLYIGYTTYIIARNYIK